MATNPQVGSGPDFASVQFAFVAAVNSHNEDHMLRAGAAVGGPGGKVKGGAFHMLWNALHPGEQAAQITKGERIPYVVECAAGKSCRWEELKAKAAAEEPQGRWRKGMFPHDGGKSCRWKEMFPHNGGKSN